MRCAKRTPVAQRIFGSATQLLTAKEVNGLRRERAMRTPFFEPKEVV
jgi:hypothetical protein